MNNKELIQKLNNLKFIKPDSQWKKDSREILFSQISSSSVSSEQNNNLLEVFTLPQKMVRFFFQPAWAAFFVSLIIIGGSVFGLQIARLSKPDSSLYIARIISEKAQLAITFNEEEKAKLGFKFANNHAKDIIEILADPDFNNEANKEKAEKLTQNFKKEIKIVRVKLKEINATLEKQPQEKGMDFENGDEIKDEGEEIQVFSANLEKDDKGVQVSPSEISQSKSDETTISQEEDVVVIPQASEGIATSTIIEENDNIGDDLEEAHKILEEVEELFNENEKDYNGIILNKLVEIDAIVESVNSPQEEGEVKGISEDGGETGIEAATTTEENMENN